MRPIYAFGGLALFVSLPLAARAQEVATVEVTPAHASVVAGGTAQFSATARDAGGDVIRDIEVAWLATPFPIAGADENGLVTTMRPGQIYVIAFAGSASGVAILDVAERPVAEVAIEAPGGTETVEGGMLRLELLASTELGDPVSGVSASWRSLRPDIAEVGPGGIVTGSAPGRATIVAEAEGHSARTEVTVRANPVAAIELSAVSDPVRTGDVVALSAGLKDGDGRAVSGGPLIWSVSGSGGQVDDGGRFVAERPGSYVVEASVGNVSGAKVIEVIPRNDPRRVEFLAFAPIPEGVQAAEVWPVGDVVYLSTIAGALYVYDISNPGAPILTDSIVVDARLLNDVSTTADGRIGVLSREGASTRRNGLLFFDASDPLHPKVINEYTEGLTGGTHSAFIYDHYVFVTDDPTGSLRIIDFEDPLDPREVARWEIEREDVRDYPADFFNVAPQRWLHDVYVKDGIAYLAYWRDGLVILDVGAGINGGSITDPRFVSQYRYNHSEIYPPDFIAGTHAVFRYGDYVFIGDESYSGVVDLHSREQFTTRGRLHVIDVSDIERPRKVAEYDPVEFGVHNFYVAEDVLYMGAYDGGIRVLDVSGELRGQLRAQGRVIGTLYTGTLDGFRPNMALTWSAVPHNGYIFASDLNTGLWVARLSPAPVP